MFASRDLILTRVLSNLTSRSQRFRLLASIVIIVGLLSAVTFSTGLHKSWLIVLSASGENHSTTVSIEKLPELKTPGPLLSTSGNPGAFSLLQACTIDCTATVPSAGQVNVAVPFQSTATTSGCAVQPTFEWDFGDNTPRSNQQNPTHSYTAAGTYTWTLTTSVSSGGTTINTVAGGLGEGSAATQAPFGVPTAIARDPQGRGIYVADQIANIATIRFINTGTATATIAGQSVAPGTVRTIAGGGQDLGENAPALNADLGAITGLGASANGDIVYFTDAIDLQVRAVNVSANAVTIGSASIGAGRIGTLATFPGSDRLSGLAVKVGTGEVFLADATAGVNKVYKITPEGGVTTVAGNGLSTLPGDPFVPGLAVNLRLLQPRAVAIDDGGNQIIADSGHARVIRVDGSGNASLINQFSFDGANPFPAGLAMQGGNVYSANGNISTVTRLMATNIVTRVAGNPPAGGLPGQICDYTQNNCGDGGAGINSGLYLLGSSADLPVDGLAGDSAGLFILDQGPISKGRVRYLNLSGGAVTLAGVTIPAGAINTIAGNGRSAPYDGGPATSSSLSSPVGVAVDANGNLWISDTNGSRLRFVNRGASPVTIFPGTEAAQTVAPGAIVTVNKDVSADQNNIQPANKVALDSPQGLFITNQGIYLTDSKGGPTVPPMQINSIRSSLIRFINTSSSTVSFYSGSGSQIDVPPGNIAKIAGGGVNPLSNGDGGFALNAKFIGASDVAVAPDGTIYVTDVGGRTVRRIDPSSGVVTTILQPTAGVGRFTGLGIGSSGLLHVANYDGNSVLRQESPGSNSFVVIATNLMKPRDVAVRGDGTALVTVSPPVGVAGNHQIVQITAPGTTSVIAGGAPGFSGDGGAPANAQINISPPNLSVGSGSGNQLPETVNIAVGPSGDIFFTDSNNNRVRRFGAGQVSCVRTGTITITAPSGNPVPTLTSINPNSATAGGQAFTLVATGLNFVATSKVRVNNVERATTFVDSTQLTAQIPASDIANGGSVTVTVVTPAPGGGTSNSLNLIINNPVPMLTNINPTATTAGGPEFTLTVNGSNFVSSSVVRLNGQNRDTSFLNSTQLSAQITAGDIATAGTAQITVVTPTPGGGTSNGVTLTINPPTPANPPTLSSLRPNAVVAGGAGFTLTLTGTNFVNASSVRVNDAARATTFISSTQLTAEIPASDIAAQAVRNITVVNPGPNGGTSNSSPLRVVSLFTSVSAASFLGNEIATESIVAGFGGGVATGIETATVQPLPTKLRGTSVKITDSANREHLAPLFFVSQSQVNYYVPPEAARGLAMVTVFIDDNIVALGQMMITDVAPGLFSANSNGKGVLAAVALRILPDNPTPIFEAVSRFDSAQEQHVPIPLDLGPGDNQVYLALFGCGFRKRSGLGAIGVKIDGVDVPVFQFAGPAPGFTGLDQLNVGPLPRSLAGRGTVNVVVTVDGKVANTVQITMK